MDIKEVFKKLESSAVFKKWRKGHSKSYLSSFFISIDGKDESPWSIGFYDKSSDTITSFVMCKKIEVSEPSKVFKERGIVDAVQLDKVKISFEKAMEISIKFRDKQYPKNYVNKTIAILQKLKPGLVWNITYITSTFNTVNIKIDAGTGKIVTHKMDKLFEFDPGKFTEK